MQRIITRIIVAILTFNIGVSAFKVWERRKVFVDACVELVRNYQD